jgi:hypothetical protein
MEKFSCMPFKGNAHGCGQLLFEGIGSLLCTWVFSFGGLDEQEKEIKGSELQALNNWWIGSHELSHLIFYFKSGSLSNAMQMAWT